MDTPGLCLTALLPRLKSRVSVLSEFMNLYISDNKQTGKKKKGIYYLEDIPKDAIVFGSTDLKKYNGGSADYLRVEDHCFRIKDTIEKDSKAVGYIPVKRREIPLGSEEKAGYIQILDGFNPLFLLAFLTLLLILCLLILSKESDFIKKANIPSILKKNTITEETVEPIDKPETTNYPKLTENIETTDNINDKDFLPKDSVFVPSDKKKVVQTNIPESAKTEPSVVMSDNDESKSDSSTEEDSSTPTPGPNTDSTDTLHVHTYVVEEQPATCTDLGFYKKYCSECGYVVADHTCAALGHTNSVKSLSSMTYPEGMKATYICDRCGETITDNFDYTSGLYKENGSLLYTYDALEQVFDWKLSTTIAKDLMDTHTELSDGRILVFTQKSVKTEAHTHSLSIDEKAPTCTEDGYYRVTCSVCGEVLADHVCKRRGHNMYMFDPEDNTANIICPVFKCNRCDYTESTNHTHNWIAKGYENMTYPDGGDAVYVCAICLNKKTEHITPIPGMYDENGKLIYTYSELEEQFNWNLSTTPAKDIMDAHAELGNGRILLLPSWQHLSEVAAESGADCGLIRGGNGINPCFTESILTEVILPNDCNDFGNWFCASNVTELELPDSITSYGRYSISSAPKLKYLKLSAGVTDLTGLSVQGNPALETLVIPEGVEKLGNTTFAGNDKLKNVTLPSTLTDIGRNVFASTGVEYLEIPTGVKEIGSSNHSLAGMSKLKTLVLNDGLEKIDSYSFSSLGALENVYIPKSVTEMGTGIFSGLDNLKSVTFQEGLTVIGDNLFQGCSNLREIIIPNSIKNIPDNLFTGVANLNLIILPEELDSIGGDGLFSCGQNSDELKIIMPTTVKEWRSGAAFSSPKLKEIVLPGNVDFPIGLINNGCGLEKVIITSEPNSIAYGAFGCLHNADIYYYGSQESVQKFNAAAGGKDVFFQDNNSNRLHYMIGKPPTRKEQMDGIDYDNLEEISIQLNLSSNEETIILNEVEQTESDFTKSVSDGNAE